MDIEENRLIQRSIFIFKFKIDVAWDIDKIVSNAASLLNLLKSTIFKKNLIETTKIKIYEAVLVPILVYGKLFWVSTNILRFKM